MDYVKLADEYLKILKNVKDYINFIDFYNFSSGENSLLLALSKKGTIETVGNLAKKLNVVPSRVTAIVNSLCKKGYVVKFQDEIDKRKSYVTLSLKGEEFLADSYLALREKFAKELEKANYDDLIELKKCLERIILK